VTLADQRHVYWSLSVARRLSVDSEYPPQSSAHHAARNYNTPEKVLEYSQTSQKIIFTAHHNVL